MMQSRTITTFALLSSVSIISTAISVSPKPKAAETTPELAGPMPLRAQEHGYHGRMVQHENGKTQVSDWGKEFGHISSKAYAEAAKLKAARAAAEAAPKVSSISTAISVSPKPKAAETTPELAGPMPLRAQEHGYHGRMVQHENGKTQVSDWGKEFGHTSSKAHAAAAELKAARAAAEAKVSAHVPAALTAVQRLRGESGEHRHGGEPDEDEVKGTPALAHPMRLTVPEQGYHGPMVKHESGKTSVSDWGMEFGPRGPQAPKGYYADGSPKEDTTTQQTTKKTTEETTTEKATSAPTAAPTTTQLFELPTIPPLPTIVPTSAPAPGAPAPAKGGASRQSLAVALAVLAFLAAAVTVDRCCCI